MTINWWTIGIQTVNVGILVWLLGRFFWKPLAAMIETRRATAKRILSEAQKARDKADAGLSDIAKTRAGFAGEREAILAIARKDAEQTGAALLESAATAAAVSRAADTAALEQDRKAIDAACVARAAHLGIDIAGRLAGRLKGSAVEAAFLDWLLQTIRALPEATRQGVTASDRPLETVSATPLGAAEQDRYRTLIGDAFGGHTHITFSTDPALVSGLELRGSSLVLRNSWRADLAQILAGLTHDHRR